MDLAAFGQPRVSVNSSMPLASKKYTLTYDRFDSRSMHISFCRFVPVQGMANRFQAINETNKHPCIAFCMFLPRLRCKERLESEHGHREEMPRFRRGLDEYVPER